MSCAMVRRALAAALLALLWKGKLEFLKHSLMRARSRFILLLGPGAEYKCGSGGLPANESRARAFVCVCPRKGFVMCVSVCVCSNHRDKCAPQHTSSAYQHLEKKDQDGFPLSRARARALCVCARVTSQCMALEIDPSFLFLSVRYSKLILFIVLFY